MGKRVSILVFLIVFSSGAFVTYSDAKEYPTRPVDLICSLSPGTSTDLMSRVAAEMAQKQLGQPFVVVNKPGAGGSLAAAEVIASKPDGYKLLVTFNSFFGTTAKTQKAPFDPNDLVPIGNMFQFKLGMFVKNDSPWKTFNDLLEYGKKNPGKLRWNHTGRGTTEHMSALLIFRKAGIEGIDIPSRGGGAEKLAQLLGGHVDASCGTYGTNKDQVTAGKIRYLIFFNDRRFKDPSNVPSATELGFPEATKFSVLVGLYAHKDTPENVKKTLIEVFKKIFQDPEFEKKIESLGEEPKYGGPEFLKEANRKLEEAGVPILKELGLYVGK